uniref:SCP domain-containing protein n=1 Tax=Ascaris lumbricoides TaxID=6252 RepID=A0A0M3HF48_ASCLU
MTLGLRKPVSGSPLGMSSTMLSFAIIAYIGYVTATNCPEVRNQGFNPSSRHVVLQRHNELRSMVANGTVEYEGGARLRSGKNIYQLVSAVRSRS